MTLLHIHPFGYETVYPSLKPTPVHVIPILEEGSRLLIGLDGTLPGQEISLLFQLEEANFHHTAHDIETVQWQYLFNDSWIPFKSSDILSDTTDNFIQSGIVTILLPSLECRNNTTLPPGLRWLSAAVTTSRTAGSKVIGIFTHAATAVRVVESRAIDTPEHLPPGFIKDFARKVPEIIKIYQLFPGWGGRKAEDITDYRLRISERLRHKDRPLNALDIAQEILQHFPEIAMVKCFGPGNAGDFVLPGVNVQIVVLPKEKADGQFLSDEPRVSLAVLSRIKQYVNRMTSCFARVEVGNPVYEKIKIVCSVRLNKDSVNTNAGYYVKKLNDDIQRFLSPWLYSTEKEIVIGGKVFVLDVLNFIQDRHYIKYVTGFSMLHFYRVYNRKTGAYESVMQDSSNGTIQYLEASRPDAVLIASSEHAIKVLDDEFDYSEPAPSGIGDLFVGSELGIVSSADHSEKSMAQGHRSEEKYFDFVF